MKRLVPLIAFAFFLSTSNQLLFAQTSPVKQWDKTFGGNGIEQLYGVEQTADGGYILAGQSDSGISGDRTQASKGGFDYWLVKLDANGNKQWDKAFGGSDLDILYAMQQTSDGGFILGGTTRSGISGDKSEALRGLDDYWVVKLDANGNKVWDKTIGGTNIEIFRSLRQTADGGYILGGSSRSGIGGDKTQTNRDTASTYDYWVVKLNAAGAKVWDRTFGGTKDDQLETLKQTSDGGYILGGNSYSDIGGDKTQATNNYSSDFWVIKLDNLGNKVWDKTIGGNNSEYLGNLIQTTDGGYLLAGSSESGISGDKTQASKGNRDCWIVKMDGSGNKLWDKAYGGSLFEFLSCLQQTPDGGFILGGGSNSNISGDKTTASKGGDDFWIVKVNSAGTKLWDKTLGGSSNDGCLALKRTADGGYILGGHSFSGISGDKTQPARGMNDFWVVKLAPDVLGEKEITRAETSLYPNPCSGILNLELKDQQPVEVIVSNSLGQCILSRTIVPEGQEKDHRLDLTQVAKGIYTVRVRSSNNIISRKILVQ
jgi:hypothetical protein